MPPPLSPPAPTAPTAPATQDWPDRIQSIVDMIPSMPGLPGFSLTTILPRPSSFDPAINALRQAAATYSVMGGHMAGPLDNLRWQGNDADEFRTRFSSERKQELTDRGSDLTDLADTLQRCKQRLEDEIAWIRDKIVEAVHAFFTAVHQAYLAARNAALEALNDAKNAFTHATNMLGNAASTAGNLIEAGVDQLTPWGGDGSDALEDAVDSARGVVSEAQATFDAIVDFALDWEFNPTTVPEGICRQWYDVDDFMARKSGTNEAYGVTYARVGRFAG